MPTSPRTIRLAPEFGCWPLWDDESGDYLDPAALPLPPALAERIARWDDAYQATLDPDYPPDSRFPDAAAEAVWRAEGEAIFEALTDLLGADRVRRRPGF
ncbi:hypothetical protein ACETK8_18575 [Brevundimonas staleyi]|uniref:Uncharacterized protein n=1 Tax=Brevundimonas staleyi TaxID=74326 RepID=A0ABW0FRU6_9CAUL